MRAIDKAHWNGASERSTVILEQRQRALLSESALVDQDASAAIGVGVLRICLDAPEKRQDFGQRSKEAVSDCAFGKIATIQASKTDRCGRTVAKAVVGGVDCGLEQIRAGLAWHYKAYEREQSPADRDTYASAEVQARTLRRGIWSLSSVEAPWSFRQRVRAAE